MKVLPLRDWMVTMPKCTSLMPRRAPEGADEVVLLGQAHTIGHNALTQLANETYGKDNWMMTDYSVAQIPNDHPDVWSLREKHSIDWSDMIVHRAAANIEPLDSTKLNPKYSGLA